MSTYSTATQETSQYASSSSSMPANKHRHLQRTASTSKPSSHHQTPSDASAASSSTSRSDSATPAASIIVQSTSNTVHQHQNAIAGPSSAPGPRTKARLDTPHAQPPLQKISKAASGTRNTTFISGQMTSAQRAAYIARYTYADMQDTSVHPAGPLLPKIPSSHETAVTFHAPDAPGVDYSLFRKATHDFLEFDATFDLYPTYCLLPAAMKPIREDWDGTRDADQDEGRKVRCLFCRSRFGGRNAKAMWERHAREHWDKGARASYEKQTKSKAPRNMSARTLAQSRGHLPLVPERSFNVVPRAPSARAAAAIASSHIAASEAGPSNSRLQTPLLRPGSPNRVTTAPVVCPPPYIHLSRAHNPKVKLSRKEQAAQDRYTPLSDSDSDVESEYTDEEDEYPSPQSTETVSTQVTPEPVLSLPPRRRFSTPCTPPPPNAEPFKVQTTPLPRPGDHLDMPDVLISYNIACTPAWTAADSEKLRKAEYGLDSPTKLLQELEQKQNTTGQASFGKRVLFPYIYWDGDEGPWMHAGASCSKRSREEDEEDEELRKVWSSCKRAKTDTASPFDVKFGEEDGLKLGDFAKGAMEGFGLEIKPLGPLRESPLGPSLETPFAEDEGLTGPWMSDAFTPSSYDLSGSGTD